MSPLPASASSPRSRSSFQDDLALAHTLADSADAISLGRFRALDLRVESKPDLSPVTDADTAVEETLRGALSRARPRDAVVGEEFGDTPGSAASNDRRWVIDPIDATKNFVRGVPVWATLIALLVGDQPVVGVVSAPAMGRRWWAATGVGAYAGTHLSNASRLRVSKVSALADASLSYSSVGGWEQLGRLDGFLDLTREVWRTRAYGDFYSYMLLAEGAVDIAAEPEVSLWDLAALVPIVTEAGGRFTDLSGVDGPGGGSALASNGVLHEQALPYLGRTPSL